MNIMTETYTITVDRKGSVVIISLYQSADLRWGWKYQEKTGYYAHKQTYTGRSFGTALEARESSLAHLGHYLNDTNKEDND